MSEQFKSRILSSGSTLFDGTVSEVLLPAPDGESGILAGHKDFIGLLGTGALKVVESGDDYWFMISSGVFEVLNGVLTVLSEVGEPADDIDIESAERRRDELAPLLEEKNSADSDYERLHIEHERAKARVEAYRRTHLVN